VSVFKDSRSPYWRFDFQLDGHRFFGSTKATTKREAEAVERGEREKAKQHIAQAKAARTSLRLDDLAGRYWQEVGQHHAGADNTWRQIEKLIEHFGKDKLITEITDDDVIKLVAWRRGHRVVRSKKAKPADCPLISHYTVNDTTEQLKKLFTRAKLWGVHFDREPQWKRHWLDEPKERVRELHASEAVQLAAHMRDDYAPFFDFLALSALRWNVEARRLRWTDVHWQEGQIKLKGKNGADVVVSITPAIRSIIWPLQGHHPEFVFTYVATRTIDKRINGRRHKFVRGKRYPLTKEGTKTAWRRLRQRAGMASGPGGFRTHDYRHNLATKLLRATGNLKLAGQALNHAKLETTMKYAHVLQDEVTAALVEVQAKISAAADTDSPIASPIKSTKVS
jgi:integrase